MSKAFENLKKISSDYKTTVDAMSHEYKADAERDSVYSDELIAQRVADRNARFNAEIDQAAQKAVTAAAPEIAKLREALRKYITTSSDPATLTTLQSLIAGGVELSNAEIAAFADGAGYAVLRLLEKPSKGHIQAPKLEAMETDLKELEVHFHNLSAYRGGMAAASSARPWGQSPAVGNVIAEGQINGFADKVDGIAGRFGNVEVD